MVLIAGVATAGALVTPHVIWKPRSSKHFGIVWYPAGTAMVVRNPLLSQVVMVSRPPAAAGGEDGEGEGTGEEEEVG
jgi:hypothetical protein